MKYKFEVTQTIYKYIEVEACDENEASSMVEKMLGEGEIRFDDEPFQKTECNYILLPSENSPIKNTNPEVCESRDNGVLRCKDRNYFRNFQIFEPFFEKSRKNRHVIEIFLYLCQQNNDKRRYDANRNNI